MRVTVSRHADDYAKKNKARFNNLRESILSRDCYRCVRCAMTQVEHIAKWGKSLTINHKDGNGRNSKYPNNDPTNLETLCLHCHGLADCMNAKWIKKHRP